MAHEVIHMVRNAHTRETVVVDEAAKELSGEAQVSTKRIINRLKRIPNQLAILFILFYRAVVSPLFPSSCRFIPTCSEYGLIAFKRYGFVKGFMLTAKRILRCRPGGSHGYDPVP